MAMIRVYPDAESLTADHLEPMVNKAIKAYLDAKFGGSA